MSPWYPYDTSGRRHQSIIITVRGLRRPRAALPPTLSSTIANAGHRVNLGGAQPRVAPTDEAVGAFPDGSPFALHFWRKGSCTDWRTRHLYRRSGRSMVLMVIVLNRFRVTMTIAAVRTSWKRLTDASSRWS